MNIPGIYLVEPYNAYATQQGSRKKHWHDIVEEQALMARIMAEQIALQEASSKTLPPNSPPTSGPTVGTPSGGAGGQPVYEFFHPELDVIAFSINPTTGAGPLTIQFTNLTQTPQFDTYLWTFGDGTTSTEPSPSHVYQSGSSATNVYTASLQVTNSMSGLGVGISSNTYISASKPTVTSAFTVVSSSNSAPSTFTFTNTSINTSQTPTTTYLWSFGTGSLTSTSADPSALVYTVAGPFTASLQSTGSYGIKSYVTRSWRLS